MVVLLLVLATARVMMVVVVVVGCPRRLLLDGCNLSLVGVPQAQLDQVVLLHALRQRRRMEAGGQEWRE